MANRTALLTTHTHEMVKSHSVYEIGTGRLTHFYLAKTDAEDGSPCMLTRYTYDGTSGRIVGRKEEEAAWDSDWDI